MPLVPGSRAKGYDATGWEVAWKLESLHQY